jgi:hypothetical protein
VNRLRQKEEGYGTNLKALPLAHNWRRQDSTPSPASPWPRVSLFLSMEQSASGNTIVIRPFSF